MEILQRLRAGDPTITIGEKYTPAMKMTTTKEARAYFEACVRHTMKIGPNCESREKARSIERQNLGYYAGYYDQETRARVERLFHCEHPIFGKASNEVTPERALRLGKMLADSR